MDGNPTGLSAQSYSVVQSAPQTVRVCTVCKHTGGVCAPGYDLLTRLRAAVTAANPGEDFEISGTVRLADCTPDHGAPCIAGWRATRAAAWFFGDIDPDQPIDDLIAFARTSAGRADPAGPDLARSPAAVIVSHEGWVQ
jgi:predicted metal-binding protein